jgi:chromosome segregation ATPase
VTAPAAPPDTPSTPEPDRSSAIGLEAGIIFLMVFVFFCIIFIQSITRGGQNDVDLLHVRTYLDQGELTAARLRLEEVLERQQDHEEARRLLERVGEQITTRDRRAQQRARTEAAKVRELETTLARTREQRTASEAALRKSEEALQEQDEALRQKEEALATQRTRSEELAARCAELESRLAEAEAEQARLAALGQEVERLQADLAREMETARTRLSQQSEELQALQVALQQARDDADLLREDLNRANYRTEEVRAAHRAAQLQAEHQAERADAAEEALTRQQAAVERALEEASTYLREDRIPEARTIYAAILLLYPEHAEARAGMQRCEPPPPDAPLEDDF